MHAVLKDELITIAEGIQPLMASQNDLSQRITLLQHELYPKCFCNRHGKAVETDGQKYEPTREFVKELSAANVGVDHWVAGWEVYGWSAAGQLLVRKNEWRRSVWPGEFISEQASGSAPRIGSKLNLFFPRESAVLQPGFYFAFGNGEEEIFDENEIVRFYWAIKSDGAAALVHGLTARLSRFLVPFRLKLPSQTSYYNRLDAAVLYVNKRFYQMAAIVVDEIYGQVQNLLWPGAPMFTKPLRPGLALAEDPGTGESFGMHRCRILAEGLCNAHEARLYGANAITEVEAQFHRNGLSLEYPYLSSGSIDQYEF